MHLQPANLKLGETYGLCQYGSWGHVNGQGEYRVIKRDKMKVLMTRESDGYTRVFSVKTNRELNKTYASRDVFILSQTDYKAKLAEQQQAVARTNAWAELAQAATNKNQSGAQAALAKLKTLGVEL
jgi:hypothetical protein